MARFGEDVYRPCPCGSGEKYKFCCREKDAGDRRRALLASVPSLDGPDGRPVAFLDLEAAERLQERALELVQRGRGEEAIPILEKAIRAAPLLPHPHNNLALARFLTGEPEKAIEVSEHVDRVVDPGNTFALGNLVHFYLVVGRVEDAERTGERLRGRRPESEDAAIRLCEAFGRLGWHEDLLEATRPGAWQGFHRGRIAFLQGTAAANLGLYERAAELLREASGDPVHSKRVKKYIDLLARRRAPATLEGDWPYFDVFEWMPMDLLARLETDERLRSYPGFVEAIVAVLNDDPAAGETPLRALGELRSPRAVEVLRRVAGGTFGTDSLRLAAMRILQERGELPDKEVDLWHSGEWKRVRLTCTEITDEAASPIPDELRGAVKRVIEAIRAGRLARAEKLAREVAAQAPDVPGILYNLAVALLRQRKFDEGERLLRRVMELDPRYLFAPAALAVVRVQQGRVPEAREVLAAVVLPEKTHPQAYASLLSAQIDVALADGDTEGALSAFELLEGLGGDWAEVAGPAVGFLRMGAGLRSLREEQERRREAERRRLLSPDAGVRECLGTYTRERLSRMAASLGLARTSALKKAPLLDRLVEHLSQAPNVLALAASLPPAARDALGDLLAHGGMLPHADFTRSHRDGEGSQEDGAVMRLKRLGLLAEGTVGTRQSVIVPVEVRTALGSGLLPSTAREPAHAAGESHTAGPR